VNLGVRIALAELMGYREWTESLGTDREWIIQAVQAEVYSKLQREASALDAYVLPLRYDYFIIVTTGLSRKEHARLLDVARVESRIPVRMTSVCGDKPTEALGRAYSMLSKVAPGELLFGECNDGLTVVAHVDINGISEETRRRGLVESIMIINDFISQTTQLAIRHGGIAQYLGGDNIIVLLPEEGYHDFAK
jgi:GTP cyclohydrolase IIa